MPGELRGLYLTIALRDQFSGGLQKANALMNQSAQRMAVIDKLARKNQERYMYMSAAFEKSLANSAFFFAQVDKIEREAFIKSRFQHGMVQKLAMGYDRLRSKVSDYASVIRSKFATINATLEEHRMALLGASMALAGFMGLSLRGAMNEEKYRRNIESLAEVIDYEKEGWQNVNKALQDYITSAEKLDYISKETRANLVSEMVTMGAAKDTILKYGPTLEKLGISLGKSTEEVITAVRSSLSGLHMPFKRLGVILREEDIKKKMEEIRQAHRNWSEEAIRAEAIMELAYPQMTRRIGDFSKATDSAYGDLVKFREKLSDLTGDIGAIYIPYFRMAVELMSRFVKFLNASPILKTATAFGTLALATALVGGFALPKAYSSLKTFYSISKMVAGFIYSRLIPATVAQAYAMGGLTAALRAAALGFKSLAVAALTNPITWAILGIAGAVLLLQHIWVKNWWDIQGKTKAAISVITGALNWLAGGIRWLIDSGRGLILWVQQGIDKLGPLKYALLGPAGAIVYLITHIDKLKSATSAALTTIRALWDNTIGGIIAKIEAFIAKLREAWNFIMNNPISKAAQMAFSFTSGGALLNTVKIVQPEIPKISADFTKGIPTPSQLTNSISTTINQPTVKNEHKTIYINPDIKIEVKEGKKEEIEKAMKEIFGKWFASHGIYG